MARREAFPDSQAPLTLDSLDNGNTLFASPDDGHERSIDIVISPAFVRFDERRVALEAIAKIYSQNAQAGGLEKAVRSNEHRPEIETRYSDPDKLAADTADKARRMLGGSALGYHLAILTKERAMVEAGASPAKAAGARQFTIDSIEKSFGTGVGANKRNQRLKQVK